MCEQISVFGSCVISSPFSKEALNCLIIQWGLVHSSWQRRSHVLNMTTSFCCRGVDRQDAAMLWAPHIRVALLHISQLTRIMKAMQRQIYWRLVLLDKCNSFCSFWKLLLKGVLGTRIPGLLLLCSSNGQDWVILMKTVFIYFWPVNREPHKAGHSEGSWDSLSRYPPLLDHG